jgi:hypothetical protein
MTQTIFRCVIRVTIGILVAVLSNLAGARTNYTDMWWNTTESGWGVTMSQDYNGPIYATFFVYAANGTASWVVGLLTIDPLSGVYSGPLLETSGGAPLSSQSFDPTAVQRSNVGTVSFTPADATNGTLAYTYRGSSEVKKQITRQSLYTADTISNATFLGSTAAGTAYIAIVDSRNNAQCSVSKPANTTSGNTYRIFPTVITSNSISLNVGQCDANSTGCVISTPLCSFTGAVIQLGRVLNVPGTLSCTTGTNFSGGLTGNFTATFSEVEHTDAGDNGKLFVTNGSCNVQSIILIQRDSWLNSLTL